jgi:hypothetical protein
MVTCSREASRLSDQPGPQGGGKPGGEYEASEWGTGKSHAEPLCRPVPRTDTRGLEEYSKASEITVVKELCKIAS